MVCQHGQSGLSQCGHFADKGRGESFFLDFVRTSFMDASLFQGQLQSNCLFSLSKKRGSFICDIFSNISVIRDDQSSKFLFFKVYFLEVWS